MAESNDYIPETFVVPIKAPPIALAKITIQGDSMIIEPRPQDNGDLIRMKTNEELATFMYQVDACPPTSVCPPHAYDEYPDCRACWLDWLNKECE